MSPGYYLTKLKNTVLTLYATPLGERQKAPGLLSGKIGNFHFDSRFVFYFADSQLVHLGDQLFHQPMLSLWKEHGYDVLVAVGGAFAPYYTSQGIRTIAPEEYAGISGAVVITKNDLAYACSRLFPNGNFFVGVNYHVIDDPRPICVALAAAVYSALERMNLGLPPLPDESSDLYNPYIPESALAPSRGPAWLEEIVSDSEARYLVYNDFVSSAAHEARKRMGVIRNLARDKRREGYRLIYSGTQQEREQSPAAPDFIDLDLRGRLAPLELYTLFALPNVHGVVTFDTFVMHVASAFRKDLYVVRKSANYPERYRRKYVPMYPGADEIVKTYL